MSHSQSDHHEAKHDSIRSAGTTQGEAASGNLRSVPANRAASAPCRIHPAYALGDWGTDVARLRAESYARACRSRAAILCASTDAEDALTCVVYAARQTFGPAETALRAHLADEIRAAFKSAIDSSKAGVH